MRKLIIICILGIFPMQTFAGNELWNDMGAVTKINADTTLSLKLGQKLTSFKTLYFYDFKPYAKYTISDLFDAIGGYRLERVKTTKWGTQNRLEGGVGIKWTLADFSFNDANQFEVIFPPSGSSATNYKNKLAVGYGFKIADQSIKLSLWDELYFGLNKSEFNRNRLTFSAATPIIQGLDLTLGYLYEKRKAGASWIGTNVLLTDLTYSL